MALLVLAVLSQSTAPPPPPLLSDSVNIGFFEDAQSLSNDSLTQDAIDDLLAHSLNSFLFTSNTPNLSVFDATPGFRVIAAPMPTLYAIYPNVSSAPSDATARATIEAITSAMSGHPSLIAMNIRDDANPARIDQFLQEKRLFEETDAVHPVSPLLVATGRTQFEVYDELNPRMWMGYYFPMKQTTVEGQWVLNYKYWWHYLREQFQLKPQADPLFLVVQGHETVNHDAPNPASDLRQPTPEEITAQMWIAFGEEANGIYVYDYSDSRDPLHLDWTGIRNLPDHYDAVGEAAAGIMALADARTPMQKIPDRFAVEDGKYCSTFQHRTTGAYAVLVVNTALASDSFTVTSDYLTGTLHDPLTDTDHALGASIPFAAGTGRWFHLTGAAAIDPQPTQQANMIGSNYNFESDLTGWSADGSPTIDSTVFYSGTKSLKITASTGGTRVSKTLAVTGSTDYYFSFRMKTANLLGVGNVGARVLQLTPSVSPNEMSNINWKMVGTRDWRKLIGYCRTASDTTAVRLDLVYTLTGSEAIWFDDVHFYKLSEPAADEYLLERPIASAVTVFKPSDYGTVTGTNAATDQGLIQSAINAAVAFDAPCRVVLDETYAVGARGGTMTIGSNRLCAYGIRFPQGAHDIEFDLTAAAFVYTQVPSLTSVNSYTWCQIGQGWDIDIDGSWQGGSNPNWLSTVITYTEHIDILATGATWDSSLLSNADLQALSTGTAVVGGNFQFAACLNCSLNGLHLDKGYGHTGAVGCNTWTRYLRVTDCTVDLVYHFCYWFDGVWDSVFDNLVATSFISTTASGFNLAPNTDNRRVSERNTVTNCDVRDVHTGIVVQGSNNLIDGNNVELIQGDNTTHYMIVVETPPSTIRGSWECADNTFSNNTGKGNGKGYGLLLKGNASAFGGGVLRVTNTLAQSNTFGDSTHRISAMLRYEAYAQDNDALSNTYYGGVLKSDASGGTATGNVDTTGGNTSS